MSRRGRLLSRVGLRRWVQVAFLLLFFGLLLIARPVPSQAPNPYLKLFFWLDPLILAATWLAAHAVTPAALLALGTVLVTLLLGRVFCGWACPLGTIHDLAGRLIHGRRKKVPSQRWSRGQLAKYYVLAAFLAMALLGGHWLSIFDPLVLLYRTTTTALMPAAQWAVEEGAKAVYQADPGWGKARLTTVTEPVYTYSRDHLFVLPKQAFLSTGLIVAFFVVIVALNAWRRRFWCRYLCPLGALLGVIGWRPLLRRVVDQQACNQCDLCGMRCHGGAAVDAGQQWKAAECLGCLNCTEACRRDAARFRLVWPWKRHSDEAPLDLSRRAAIWAAVGGVAGLAAMRATPQGRGRRYHPYLIRPPGSRPEREFLQRCTACGLCMKICPTGGLQPAVTQAGLEGLWTPRLVPQIGYCDYECNRCGLVCPTEAIRPITVDEKHQTKMGLAAFDVTRCIPYAYGRDCMVCEEHCPIPDKAIYFVEVQVRRRDGSSAVIKQPRVDPDKCIGCGVCEHVCPYRDKPGIRVTSANESRHPENQPILPDWDSPY